MSKTQKPENNLFGKTKKDSQGFTLAEHSCQVCKHCWIYIDGPAIGKCIYAGPFTGYYKEDK